MAISKYAAIIARCLHSLQYFIDSRNMFTPREQCTFIYWQGVERFECVAVNNKYMKAKQNKKNYGD